MIRHALALAHAWLVLDFYGAQRERGESGSSLTSTIFTQSFFALVVAALLFDDEIRVVPYAAANLSLSTVLVGMSVLGAPARLSRRLADRMLAETAPLAAGTLPLARVGHGAFYIVLVTTGMAIPPGVLMYWVADRSLSVVPAYIALASVLAGILAGAAALVLRAVERWRGAPQAALVAGSLKALLLGGSFIAFALGMTQLTGTADDLPLGRTGALCWPPYWAARWLAEPAAGLTFGAAIVGLGLGLFVLRSWVGEAERRASHVVRFRNGLLARIEFAFARRGPLLGTVRFVSTMLFRSPGFRARVLPLFGMPLAMILLAFWENSGRERLALVGMTLQFPAIYLPFLIMFLPFGEQEGSGWMFDTSPRSSLALAREASLISLSVRILLPVQLVAATLLLAGGFGVITTTNLTVFSWALAVLIASLSVRRLDAMPFTTVNDEAPGGELGGLMGAAIVLAVLGCGFSQIAHSWVGSVIAVTLLALAIRRLSNTSRHAVTEERA